MVAKKSAKKAKRSPVEEVDLVSEVVELVDVEVDELQPTDVTDTVPGAGTIRAIPNKRLIVIAAGILIVALIALVPSLYFYVKYSETQKKLTQNPANQQENDKILLEKLAKHTILPQDEPARFATVSDASSLADQYFFRNAKNGDRVIVFATSRKAILYRPDIDRIVEMGPVQEQQATSSAAKVQGVATPAATTKKAPKEPDVEASARVAVYNGGYAPGLALQTQQRLESAFGDKLTVVTKSNALSEYGGNTVIILSPEFESIAKDIAKQIDASVTSDLPSDESKPQADILVIVQ